MSPLGPYPDFKACVLANQDKRNPEAYCGFLENRIHGQLPADMAGQWPDAWFNTYEAALVSKKSEAEAFEMANNAAKEAGFEFTRQGWIKQFQAPKLKSIKGAVIFSEGEWTDSSGETRTWSAEDLDNMVAAFKGGVPLVVPLKCGHTSDKFNRKIAEALGVPVEVLTGEDGHGAIKLGDMISLEHRGTLLIAGFDKIPETIADLVEGGQYSAVSVEVEDRVGDFGPVITGVALLGAEEPAVDKAKLESARVFAFSKREGARELSFSKESDFPSLKNKVKAAFAALGDMIEKLVGKTDESAPGANPSPDNKDGNFEKDGIIMDLTKLAAALGLGEAATEEECLAKIAELLKAVQGEVPPVEAPAAAPMAGAMSAELKAAQATIADLQKKVNGQTLFSKWQAKTAAFTAIPGKPEDYAKKLVEAEEKAGEDFANTQFAAFEETNKLAAEALLTRGTSRVQEATDFDNEVAKYQKDNPGKSKAEAIDAVSTAKPDLWFARRK
ncbi:MAG: hypothetical protein WC329_01595 [Candidatus Omnitrophota bacterium]|jgi:hypothetical protein